MMKEDLENKRSGPVDVDEFIQNWWEGEPGENDMRDGVPGVSFVRDWLPSEAALSCGAIRRNRMLVGGVGLLAIVLIAIIASAASGNNESPPPEYATISEQDKDLFNIVEAAMTSEDIPTDDLLRINGHQYKAFVWLTGNANLTDYEDIQKIQRFALASFYYATFQVTNEYTENPEPWFQSVSWVTDTDECEWFGIHCTADKQVHSISLEKNKMSGNLPKELALLRHSLISLDLSSNDICMKGDDLELFRYLHKLEKLEIDDNYLLTGDGIPSSLSACTDLRKLTISYNLMEGPLDNGVLGDLTKLTHLEIESNFLTGDLPALNELSNLEYLYLRHNMLSPNLDFIKSSNLTKLASLWLDGNSISQTIPTEIGLMTSLSSISMSNANLTGTIPTEFGLLTNLQRLWLFNNQLTGKIPSQLEQLVNLEVLKLEGNSIKGHMPTGLCTIIEQSVSLEKELSADCEHVKCDCCTPCNSGRMSNDTRA